MEPWCNGETGPDGGTGGIPKPAADLNPLQALPSISTPMLYFKIG